MRRGLPSWAIALPGLAAVAGAPADVVVLRDGQTLDVEIIREFQDRVIIDLGFDLVAVPREWITEIAQTPTESATAAAGGESGALYETARLPVRSIEELTTQFGEGVVLVSSPTASGSGFLIHPDGYMITNFHVIEDETRLAVTIFRRADGEFQRLRIENVEIIATNPFMDLALLRIPLPDKYAPTITYLSARDDLRDGDTVFAIGNPLGFERSVSQGIISQRNRADEGLVYLQTTTQINPGNSGGPLFNNRGEMIGVTNMKIMGGEGLGFAIPIRYVIDFVENREAFAYDATSSSAGYRYLDPPKRQRDGRAPLLDRPSDRENR